MCTVCERLRGSIEIYAPEATTSALTPYHSSLRALAAAAAPDALHPVADECRPFNFSERTAGKIDDDNR